MALKFRVADDEVAERLMRGVDSSVVGLLLFPGQSLYCCDPKTYAEHAEVL